MLYRREIDGLRAVAVLPVILFHGGLELFSGGFVGVDVFFVISGYLITTILLDDHRRGRFSILRFYERRARRILPALTLILACSLPFAVLWMPTAPFEDFARSLTFTALFASNVHFWEKAGGYFALRSELQPLLHTWSLAVEEQFYLIFPLLLGLLLRLRRSWVMAVLAGLALMSLALSEWGWRNYLNANFYFTFSRFWELLAGSLCALVLYRRPVASRGWPAALGLAMILGAMVIYDAGTPFPSVFTLVPVAGTALIILFAARDTLTARLLSFAPFVGIGLISYSAYLWHQPIFALARLRSLTEPSAATMIGLGALSLILACASWRFVEQPFRTGPRPLLADRRALFAASGAAVAVFAAIGLHMLLSDLWQHRLDGRGAPRLTAALEKLDERPVYRDCTERALPREAEALMCTAYGPDRAETVYAVVGDSHAESLLPGFEALSRRMSARIVVATQSACPPLLDVFTARSRESRTRCHRFARKVADDLAQSGIAAVFLVSKWSLYTPDEERPYNARFLLSRSAGTITRDPAISRRVFAKALHETIRFYREAGIRVFLVAQVPEHRVAPRFLLEKLILAGQEPPAADRTIAQSFVGAARNDAVHGFANSVLRRHAGTGVAVLSFDDVFRSGDRYHWFAAETPLYRDNSHLSLAGARLLGKPLADRVAAHLARAETR